MNEGKLPPTVEPASWRTVQMGGPRRKLSTGQGVAHRRILHRCYEAIRRGYLETPIEDTSVRVEPASHFTRGEIGPILLEPAEISLPPKGVGGSVDFGTTTEGS